MLRSQHQGQNNNVALLTTLQDMQNEAAKRRQKGGEGYGALDLVLRCFLEVIEKGHPKLPSYSYDYIWSTLPKSLSNPDE